MLKNTAGQVIGAQMVSATDGSEFTGAVTVYVTGDGAAQAAGSVGAGACAHEGHGFHSYTPAQAETNYAHVAYTFVGSGAVTATIQAYPIAGDAFTRLGVPVGASISADIAGVQADTDNIQTRLPAALVGGRMDSSVGAMQANVMTAAAAAADLTTELQSGLATAAAVTAVASDVTAVKAKTDNLPPDPADQSLVIAATDAIYTRIGAPAGASIAADIAAIDAGSGLDAAGVRAAIGMAAANLDTQLSGIQSDTNDIQTRLPAALVGGRIDASVGAMAANVMTAAAAAADLTTELQSGLATAAAVTSVAGEVTAVKAKTDNLPTDPADQSLIIAAIAAISTYTPAQIADAVLHTQMSEDYANVGAEMTLQQALYMLWAILGNRKVVGDVLTAGALDASPAMTFLLDDVVSPTEQVRNS